MGIKTNIKSLIFNTMGRKGSVFVFYKTTEKENIYARSLSHYKKHHAGEKLYKAYPGSLNYTFLDFLQHMAKQIRSRKIPKRITIFSHSNGDEPNVYDNETKSLEPFSSYFPGGSRYQSSKKVRAIVDNYLQVLKENISYISKSGSHILIKSCKTKGRIISILTKLLGFPIIHSQYYVRWPNPTIIHMFKDNAALTVLTQGGERIARTSDFSLQNLSYTSKIAKYYLTNSLKNLKNDEKQAYKHHIQDQRFVNLYKKRLNNLLKPRHENTHHLPKKVRKKIERSMYLLEKAIKNQNKSGRAVKEILRKIKKVEELLRRLKKGNLSKQNLQEILKRKEGRRKTSYNTEPYGDIVNFHKSLASKRSNIFKDLLPSKRKETFSSSSTSGFPDVGTPHPGAHGYDNDVSLSNHNSQPDPSSFAGTSVFEELPNQPDENQMPPGYFEENLDKSKITDEETGGIGPDPGPQPSPPPPSPDPDNPDSNNSDPDGSTLPDPGPKPSPDESNSNSNSSSGSNSNSGSQKNPSPPSPPDNKDPLDPDDESRVDVGPYGRVTEYGKDGEVKEVYYLPGLPKKPKGGERTVHPDLDETSTNLTPEEKKRAIKNFFATRPIDRSPDEQEQPVLSVTANDIYNRTQGPIVRTNPYENNGIVPLSPEERKRAINNFFAPKPIDPDDSYGNNHPQELPSTMPDLPVSSTNPRTSGHRGAVSSGRYHQQVDG